MFGHLNLLCHTFTGMYIFIDWGWSAQESELKVQDLFCCQVLCWAFVTFIAIYFVILLSVLESWKSDESLMTSGISLDASNFILAFFPLVRTPWPDMQITAQGLME